MLNTKSNRSELLIEDLKDLKSFSPLRSPLNSKVLGVSSTEYNAEFNKEFDKKYYYS